MSAPLDEEIDPTTLGVLIHRVLIALLTAKCNVTDRIGHVFDITISFSPNWIPCFKRWARVQLPNKQIVRTAWKEKSQSKSVRTSRNVMVSPVRLIVQVYSTFSLHIYSGLKSFTESKQQTLGRFSFSSVQPLPKTRQRGLPLFLSMAHLIEHFSMTQAMRYGYLHIKVMKI